MIANSVALAMLERRRELAIFKSVGYTQSMVLAQNTIEYGLIGILGAICALPAMVFAAAILNKALLGQYSWETRPLRVRPEPYRHRLRDPLSIHEILPEELPAAWQEEITTAETIMRTLSQQRGQILLWELISDVLAQAFKTRKLDRTTDSKQ